MHLLTKMCVEATTMKQTKYQPTCVGAVVYAESCVCDTELCMCCAVLCFLSPLVLCSH